MTVSVNFFLLCENFIVDDKQRPSIINIYDNIWSQQFPATHPKLVYASNINIQDSGTTKSAIVELKIENE